MADTKIIIQKPSAEEIEAFRQRTIELADRSYINDRLNVQLPEHLYGEWIGTDDFSQYNASLRGFVDGSEYLSDFNRLHEGAVGSSVGDVKFMVIPKWKQDIFVEAAQEESRRRAGFSGPVPEEAGYKQQAKNEGIGVISEEQSSTRTITGTELQAQLKG